MYKSFVQSKKLRFFAAAALTGLQSLPQLAWAAGFGRASPSAHSLPPQRTSLTSSPGSQTRHPQVVAVPNDHVTFYARVSEDDGGAEERLLLTLTVPAVTLVTNAVQRLENHANRLDSAAKRLPSTSTAGIKHGGSATGSNNFGLTVKSLSFETTNAADAVVNGQPPQASAAVWFPKMGSAHGITTVKDLARYLHQNLPIQPIQGPLNRQGRAATLEEVARKIIVRFRRSADVERFDGGLLDMTHVRSSGSAAASAAGTASTAAPTPAASPSPASSPLLTPRMTRRASSPSPDAPRVAQRSASAAPMMLGRPEVVFVPALDRTQSPLLVVPARTDMVEVLRLLNADAAKSGKKVQSMILGTALWTPGLMTAAFARPSAFRAALFGGNGNSAVATSAGASSSSAPAGAASVPAAKPNPDMVGTARDLVNFLLELQQYNSGSTAVPESSDEDQQDGNTTVATIGVMFRPLPDSQVGPTPAPKAEAPQPVGNGVGAGVEEVPEGRQVEDAAILIHPADVPGAEGDEHNTNTSWASGISPVSDASGHRAPTDPSFSLSEADAEQDEDDVEIVDDAASWASDISPVSSNLHRSASHLSFAFSDDEEEDVEEHQNEGGQHDVDVASVAHSFGSMRIASDSEDSEEDASPAEQVPHGDESPAGTEVMSSGIGSGSEYDEAGAAEETGSFAPWFLGSEDEDMAGDLTDISGVEAEMNDAQILENSEGQEVVSGDEAEPDALEGMQISSPMSFSGPGGALFQFGSEDDEAMNTASPFASPRSYESFTVAAPGTEREAAASDEGEEQDGDQALAQSTGSGADEVDPSTPKWGTVSSTPRFGVYLPPGFMLGPAPQSDAASRTAARRPVVSTNVSLDSEDSLIASPTSVASIEVPGAVPDASPAESNASMTSSAVLANQAGGDDGHSSRESSPRSSFLGWSSSSPQSANSYESAVLAAEDVLAQVEPQGAASEDSFDYDEGVRGFLASDDSDRE